MVRAPSLLMDRQRWRTERERSTIRRKGELVTRAKRRRRGDRVILTGRGITRFSDRRSVFDCEREHMLPLTFDPRVPVAVQQLGRYTHLHLVLRLQFGLLAILPIGLGKRQRRELWVHSRNKGDPISRRRPDRAIRTGCQSRDSSRLAACHW
jgi:hypothetical protein